MQVSYNIHRINLRCLLPSAPFCFLHQETETGDAARCSAVVLLRRQRDGLRRRQANPQPASLPSVEVQFSARRQRQPRSGGCDGGGGGELMRRKPWLRSNTATKISPHHFIFYIDVTSYALANMMSVIPKKNFLISEYLYDIATNHPLLCHRNLCDALALAKFRNQVKKFYFLLILS